MTRGEKVILFSALATVLFSLALGGRWFASQEDRGVAAVEMKR